MCVLLPSRVQKLKKVQKEAKIRLLLRINFDLWAAGIVSNFMHNKISIACVCIHTAYLSFRNSQCPVLFEFYRRSSKTNSFTHVHRLNWAERWMIQTFVESKKFIIFSHFSSDCFSPKIYFCRRFIEIFFFFCCFYFSQTDISSGRCQWKTEKQRQKERSKTVEERAKSNKAR